MLSAVIQPKEFECGLATPGHASGAQVSENPPAKPGSRAQISAALSVMSFF